MSSSIVITLAAIGGIAWLGFILVAALRRRGPEEIPSNLAPGTTDDQMETRRLESGQKAAVLLSAFLAVSLPLYYLGEQQRQEGFVEQFSEESVERGAALVEEFACYDCHGPEGVGGVAPFVEARSGVAVSWVSPPLDDVFYRYDEDAVNYWLTFGRGNSPMPAWGLEGGGPMNEKQIIDIVHYLRTIQISQEEAVARAGSVIPAERNRLANADSSMESALVSQRQVLADIEKAEERAPVISEFAARARALLEAAADGIDTDGDGLSDATEVGLVEIGEEIVSFYQVIEPVTLDPENPQSVEGQDDLATAQMIVDRLTELVESGQEPILEAQRAAAVAAFEDGLVEADIALSAAALDELAALAEEFPEAGPGGDIVDLNSAEQFVASIEAAAAEDPDDPELAAVATDARSIFDDGQDPDGDGLSTAAERTLSAQVTDALNATMPSEAVVPVLDPTNEATSGEPDAAEAARVVGAWESLATTTTVTANNIEAIRAGAVAGIDFLEQSHDARRWVIDIDGVAERTFGGDYDTAERAVLLYQGYCARCHTAGHSAGVPFTLEAGSGGFGPALWDGRPVVQFGAAADDPESDLLIDFLINGSVAEEPYGLNGFGSGRMPGFGMVLSLDDISLIAQYLRGGDMTGRGPAEVGP